VVAQVLANADLDEVAANEVERIPYSLLLLASSPYAKRGILYSNFAKHFGQAAAPVLIWKGATQEMNANLADDDQIAEMYRDDPERAAAEHGAEFRSDIVDFITRKALAAAKARGKKLGGFRGRAGTAEDTAKARKAHTAKAASHAASLVPIITRLDPNGSLSLRALAAKLTAEGLPTPAGAAVWTAATVARVKAKLAA
jgi:hypothetical protein